ncbi:MAG: hypothetical protein A3K10_05465 [Bacteroidetes bacterium RIFCSPLOWO2_12_FULL_31_6]|nr:MAG: hypothetical protein A3K10_05465 [Bacteroidetes bacterium RIFCSPLOWO2_12_FULL_31_6]
MNWFCTRFSEYDISILRFVHHNRNVALDGFLYNVSFATTFVSITLLGIILLQLIKRKSPELRINFFKILTVLVLSGVMSLILKYSIIRDRPFVSYPDIEKLSEAGNSSFPSGHTIEAFAMAFAISTLFPYLKFVIPVFLWALLIAYSRMALGVHYPFDVLAGMVIGVLISYCTITVFNKVERKINKVN